MRTFLVGAVAGAALGAVAGYALGSAGPGDAPDAHVAAEVPAAPPTSEDRQRPDAPPPLLETRPPPAAPKLDAQPFPAGECVLRPGDGYVFGEARVRPAGTPESDVDVFCRDHQFGPVLATPYGAAAVPMALFLPTESLCTVPALYAAVHDAPLELGDLQARLFPKANKRDTNLAFIRAASGTVYKVRVLEVNDTPNVWERWARLRYEPVPQVEGGGHPDFGPPPASAAADVATRLLLEQVDQAPKVPGDSFRSFLRARREAYRTLTGLPPALDLAERSYVALPARLDTSITTTRSSGIVAQDGIGPQGKVTIRAYTGVAVEGDMEGEIDVRSYAYLHIRGDLVGTVTCDSYTTLFVEGDLLGTVWVKSYTRLYVRGRVPEPSTGLRGLSSGSTFFLDGFTSERDVRSMAGGGATLQLRESDLPAGTHAVPGWKEVVVGGKAWKDLR